MNITARKIVLPTLNLTELAEPSDPAAMQVEIQKSLTYYVKPKLIPGQVSNQNGKPNFVATRHHQFPLILNNSGAPWPEANLWILSILESKYHSNIATTASIAEDLAAYLRFIEEYKVDWLDFPSSKLHRPTYRFNGYLKLLIHSEEIAASTAKRRMATIIRFYQWIMDENLFRPENTPWKQNDRHIEFYGSYGERRLKNFKTTDISISATKQENPYVEWIDDGIKLRPLPQQEQVWLLDALITLKNYEMLLIHLFGLLTGARMQTILTFRVRDALKNHLIGSQNSLRYPVGPGTGIDTKNDKQLILHFPVWFYNMLSAYSGSARAKRRRLKAHGGDTEDQYLFLSVRGTPLYTSRHDETSTFLNSIRHRKIGQGVRQYITDYIIPFIQQKYDRRFHYRFHDTRATFGMNMVDERMKLVEEKKIPLADVMNFVQIRMGHASLATTERYLNYRSRQKLIHAAQDGWEAKLEQIARTEFEK